MTTILSILVVLMLGLDLFLCVVLRNEWKINPIFRIDLICARKFSLRVLWKALSMMETRPGLYLTSLVLGYFAIGLALYHLS